jgi:hypothetical protein
MLIVSVGEDKGVWYFGVEKGDGEIPVAGLRKV